MYVCSSMYCVCMYVGLCIVCVCMHDVHTLYVCTYACRCVCMRVCVYVHMYDIGICLCMYV